VTLFRDITVDYVAVRIKTKFGTSGQRWDLLSAWLSVKATDLAELLQVFLNVCSIATRASCAMNLPVSQLLNHTTDFW